MPTRAWCRSVRSSVDSPSAAPVRSFLGWTLFLLLGGAITAVGSERMFWFWSSNPLDHWITAVVYAVPFSAALWAISRFGVRGLTSMLLVAPLFAYVTEGIITPVMYSGGPMVPVFPAWFTFWHGFIGLVTLWYLLHLWLVRGRRGLVLAAAGGLGTFWGLWSTTLWLPENVDDPELIADQGSKLTVLGPWSFTRYVVAFSVLLAVFHWVWGRLDIPPRFDPPRWLEVLYAVAVATMLVVWTASIPWALPMFVAYAGLQIFILRRGATSGGPTLLQDLAGPVSIPALLMLSAMPVAATGVYWLAWQIGPAEDTLRLLMVGTIAVQAAIAVVVVAVAALRVLGSPGDGGPGARATPATPVTR